MNSYFTAHATHKYIDVLQKLLNEYNNRIHSSIKMTPNEAIKKKNHDKVFETLYGDITQQRKEEKPKFNIGDFVRISRLKGTFEKSGYNWSPEIYKIIGISHGDPIMYSIQDLTGQELTGKFYTEELQKTQLHDLFFVEKVLQRRTINKKKEVLVKWYGYPEDQATWEPAENIE
jgi:hypothetical protein